MFGVRVPFFWNLWIDVRRVGYLLIKQNGAGAFFSYFQYRNQGIGVGNYYNHSEMYFPLGTTTQLGGSSGSERRLT
jgi:hypothetical protein